MLRHDKGRRAAAVLRAVGLGAVASASLQVTVGCGGGNVANDSQTQAIYGTDDRKEVFQLDRHDTARTWAAAVAVFISKEKVAEADRAEVFSTETITRGIDISGPSYGDEAVDLIGNKLCRDEPFVGQPTLGSCTAFLVTPNLIATAGHCAVAENACRDHILVFDFAYLEGSADAIRHVKKENIYRCAKVVRAVVANAAGGAGRVDYGLIRLDRDVEDRTPLQLRESGTIAETAALTLVGSPVGLPVKVAAGAKVRDNTSSPQFFVASTDSYGGNSGSPVIDSATGLVEGILIRGARDFTFDPMRQCYRSRRCAEGGCRGEDVARARVIADAVKAEGLWPATWETTVSRAGTGD